MSEQELFKEFVDKVCPSCTCKCTECSKGIRIVKDYKNKTLCAKCDDYEKDKSKLKGYVKPLQRTAKVEHTVMPKLISDWSNI